MYTIGQFSKMFNIPISTIRYYDKEGLFPELERKSGIRQFGQREIDALETIEYLKASGLQISEIKKYIDWSSQGADTYEKRLNLFKGRKDAVEKEMVRLQKILDLLNYKCWYYEKAIEEGSEDHLKEMIPEDLPPEIKKQYENGHFLKIKI